MSFAARRVRRRQKPITPGGQHPEGGLDRRARQLLVEWTVSRINDKRCSEPGCDRKHAARGLCDSHYKQALRWGGETRPIVKPGPPAVRLPGLRISRRAAEALEKRGPTVYQAAQATIEEGTRGT